MRHKRKIVFLLTVVFFGVALSSYALDIGTEFWIGNLAFPTDLPSTAVTFPGSNYLWGISAYATQSLADNFNFEAGFFSDPILRNISYTLFSYSERILTIGVGPFFGFFNDLDTLLKPGISTAVTIEIPGIIFVNFRSDSSIGGELVLKGAYFQERTDVSLGFYIKNAICSFNLKTKKFTQEKATADVIPILYKTVDGLTEYSFSTDIFQKNVPFQVTLTYAYQSLSKTFIFPAPAAPIEDIVNSIVIEAEMDLSLGDAFVFYSTLEGGIYSFGQGQLLGNAAFENFLFRLSSGIRLNVDTISNFARMF
jgi:hypothetical protein